VPDEALALERRKGIGGGPHFDLALVGIDDPVAALWLTPREEGRPVKAIEKR
jgi:hypothetical protein